jgi:hypothetical protein
MLFRSGKMTTGEDEPPPDEPGKGMDLRKDLMLS